MRKNARWLALFLTGTLLFTTLTACKSKQEDEEEDEDEQTEKDDSSKKKLSPEEVYDALLDADEVSFAFLTELSVAGEASMISTVLVRDGDKLQNTADVEGEQIVTYSDLAKGRDYYEDDGEWYYTASTEEIAWDKGIQATLASTGIDLETLFFDDDSYDKKGSRYALKEEVIADACGAESGEMEGLMKRNGTTYSFEVTFSEDDTMLRIGIEIIFEDMTVELPEATESEGPTQSAPLTDDELYDWMDANYALDYEVDTDSLHSNVYDFFWDAPLYGLFDDIYEYDGWGSGKMGYAGDYGIFYWSMYEPVTLNGYVLYTGNDSDLYKGRNPVSWYLFGSNDDFREYTYDNDPSVLTELGWELIDYVEDGGMEDRAAKPYGYLIDENLQGEYQHYCWFVVEGGDRDALVQVNGLRLYAESFWSGDDPIVDDPIVDDPVVNDPVVNEWDDAWGEPIAEDPMIDEEVEEWMKEYELVNDHINVGSMMSSTDLFFEDGWLYNLFDEYYSMSDWSQGVRDGLIYIGYGSAGKMGYTGPQASFYWEMDEAVTLGSYVIYTGNDSATWPGRAPVGWFLLGSNTPEAFPMNNLVKSLEETGWTVLDAVYDGNIQDIDSKPFGYTIDEKRQGEYKYYCWLVDYGGDWEGQVQVNGMKLFSIDEADDTGEVDPPAVGGNEPMTNERVEAWMDSHTMVNNKIDPFFYDNSEVGFFTDGQLSNLFDDIYTEEEWNAALADGLIYSGYGSLGKMGYTSEYFPAAFYWGFNEEVTLGSYVIYTGNDNAGNPGRNPLNWCLLGTNELIYPSYADLNELLSYGWTILDTVEGSGMEDVNFTPYGYTIDEENQGAYRYYCWIVYDSNLLVQVNGMKLYAADTVGQTATGDREEIDTARLLAPSEFMTALCGDDDMTVTSDMKSGVWELSIVCERDGNRAKDSSDAGDGVWVSYYDFDAGKVYRNSLGTWVAENAYPVYPDHWEELVKSHMIGEGWEMFFVIGGDYEVLFEDDHFILQDGRYVATEAFLAECEEKGRAEWGDELYTQWYGENPTYEIFFEYEDGTHTFSYRFFDEYREMRHEMILTLTFSDTAVTLPETAV